MYFILKNFVGLFFPVFWSEQRQKYVSTIEIAGIPFGWIILLIAAIVKVI